MKYGVHLSTFCAEWDEDVLKFISKVKEYGYDGVEIPLMNPQMFEIKKTKKILMANQLQATCGTGLNPSIDISSNDINIRKNGEEHLRSCINICNELESDSLAGVLYAPWGQHKSGQDARDSINRSLESLAKIGDYAKSKGVVLALEMLNRYESYFLNTVEQGKEYLNKINHENIKLHLDTFHSNIEEKDLYQAIKNGNQDIYHIHICENDRGTPGTGSVDWINFKKGLNEINYDRWLTVECFVKSNCGAGNDVCIWRDIEEDSEIVVRDSIKFLKKLMEE